MKHSADANYILEHDKFRNFSSVFSLIHVSGATERANN